MNIYENKCFMDTDVFVNAFVDLDETKKENSRRLLDQASSGSVKLVTDFLVLIESFYTIEKYKGTTLAIKVLKESLSLGNLEIISINQIIYFESIKRVGRYNLKFNDLVHYTVALLNNVSGIYSYDKHFDKLEIKRIEP